MAEFCTSLLDTIKNSKREAHVYYDERRTYAQMHETMRRINSVLPDRENERIAIYAIKGFATYGAIAAVLVSGNTWVPINPQMPNG